MGFKAVENVISHTHGLAPGEKWTLAVIARFADEDGFCFPSQRTLAELTGFTDRTLRSHLKALERAGLIRRVHRQRADGSRTSDAFTIHLPCGKDFRMDMRKKRTNQAEGMSGSTGKKQAIQPEENSGHESGSESITETVTSPPRTRRPRVHVGKREGQPSNLDKALELARLKKEERLARDEKLDRIRQVMGDHADPHNFFADTEKTVEGAVLEVTEQRKPPGDW